MHMNSYTYMCIYIYISISLYIYIYIFIFIGDGQKKLGLDTLALMKAADDFMCTLLRVL